MRIVIDLDGVRHEVELGQHADTATLADLVESATGARVGQGEALWVDDHRHAPDDRLRHVTTLLEGSQISRRKLERPLPLRGWSVTVSGGMDAGRSYVLPPDRQMLIGRSAEADIVINSPSASRRHATFEIGDSGVRVRDLGSTNATLVDGKRVTTAGAEDSADTVGNPTDSDQAVKNLSPGPKGSHDAHRAALSDKRAPSLQKLWPGKDRKQRELPSREVAGDGAVVVVGGTALTLRFNAQEPLAPAPGTLHNVSAAGTAPFNRPPRPGRRRVSEPIEPPTRKPPGPPVRFNIVAVAAPLLLAVVMVIVMKSAQFAVIALLSPVIALGTYYEQKRRHRRDIEDEDARFAKALSRFSDEIDEAVVKERARLREENPDPATAIRAASLPTTRLWQRRPGAEDYLELHCGIGHVPWKPDLDSRSSGRLDNDVKQLLEDTRLGSAPIEAELTNAGVVGIIGDRDGALAVARSLLCQAAVHCGPADLTIGVFCDQGREESWSWTTWLPHVRVLGDGSGGQWLSAQRDRSEALLRSMRDDLTTLGTPTVLLVIDSDVLTEGRDAPARSLLGHGRRVGTSIPSGGPTTEVSGIVVAATEEALPASVNSVIRVGSDALGVMSHLGEVTTVDDIVLAGISVETARRCALDLARFEDPELVVPGSGLPTMVRLVPLLGLDDVTADAIRRSWSASARIDTPIGTGENRVLTLDLVRDGPHGLVGGTTGSGKSEFLRTLVAGLAARSDPTTLTFILIDFKGGAAFAACERMPHTIGTVSNLDEQLADRALRALEAELRYRQTVFAQAGEGIDNLDAYLATNPAEPMPRLLVVVDEFAMLAKDYPDVLSSLVSVAAVGRTLGVHMILATQRPAGVVNDDILANTNLRVALRVQSREDSSNVIGVPDASGIGRTQMGRAYVKLGQDDITPVQTALVTGRSESSHAALVETHPVAFGEAAVKPPAPQKVDEDAPTDLDLLIDAIVAANDDLGYAPPRPVWPEPLGAWVDLAATSEHDGREPVVGGVTGSVVQIGLSDDPDRQRQIPAGWDINAGNLLLLGIPGSGTSTALASLALTLAAERSPDELDLLVLDLGPRDLAPLADLPHTAAYVGPGAASREQQVRFLKYLRQQLDRRRANPGGHREMLVLIDGLAALKDEYGEDSEGLGLLGGLYSAYADGPDVGMHFAVSTARAKAVPSQIDEVTTQKWLFRLADPYDYASAGLDRKLAPPPVPGRCVPSDTKLQTHVASPSMPLPEAVARVGERWEAAGRKRTVIGRLPECVTLDELGVVAQLTGEPWRIPVGIRESDLEPGWVEVYEGEHLLVAGPARSGKSTLLLTIGEAIRRGAAEAGKDVAIWGVCGRRSPLAGAEGLDKVAVGGDDLAPLLASARVHRGPLVLLFDDAEKYDDSDQAISGLLSARTSDLLVVAAGRSDDLRSMYSHWTKTIRKSRAGVVLQPNIDYDGDLLSGSLPRRAPVALTTGRGYLAVGGTYELVQCASSSEVTQS